MRNPERRQEALTFRRRVEEQTRLLTLLTGAASHGAKHEARK